MQRMLLMYLLIVLTGCKLQQHHVSVAFSLPPQRRSRHTGLFAPIITTTTTNRQPKHGLDALFQESGFDIDESSRLKNCHVELIDPETGCQVILLGCFHGSQSSAMDVQYALTCAGVDTNVVVLELCASRFSDLRRDVLGTILDQEEDEGITVGATTTTTAISETATYSSSTSDDDFGWSINNSLHYNSNDTPQRILSRHRKPWIERYSRMVQRMVQTRGLSSGAAAAILGGVTSFQTALSGLHPGLEFITALRIATATEKDIVLADQNVDETLYKLGKLPSLSFQMWRQFLTSWDWQASFGQEAAALKLAILGDDQSWFHGNSSSFDSAKRQQQVNLVSFLTRNDSAVRDLIRLLLPPLAVVQGMNFLVPQIIGLMLDHYCYVAGHLTGSLDGFTTSMTSNVAVATTAAATVGGDHSFEPWIDMSTAIPASWITIMEPYILALTTVGSVLMVNAAILGFTYLSLALPAARVVLCERDEQLAAGIRQACQLATTTTAVAMNHSMQTTRSKHLSFHDNEATIDCNGDNHSASQGRVVAVMGFLHVNGVAKKFMQQQQQHKVGGKYTWGN